jgi:hypothetical protein
MRTVLVTLVSLMSTLLCGCLGALTPSAAYIADPQVVALPQWTVYQGSTGSLSYQTAVGRDGQRFIAAPRVQGRACQHGLQVPILGIVAAATNSSTLARGPAAISAGWGDGGYRAAVDNAKAKLPKEAILYDVRADMRHRLILTVYHEQCVVIDAGVLLPLLKPVGT